MDLPSIAIADGKRRISLRVGLVLTRVHLVVARSVEPIDEEVVLLARGVPVRTRLYDGWSVDIAETCIVRLKVTRSSGGVSSRELSSRMSEGGGICKGGKLEEGKEQGNQGGSGQHHCKIRVEVERVWGCKDCTESLRNKEVMTGLQYRDEDGGDVEIEETPW